MFNRRMIINVSFIAVILLGGLWAYGYIANPTSVGVSGSAGSNNELSFSYQTNQEFTEFLQKITSISLNFKLLDTINNQLTDFSLPLPDIATSRPNPFAPVGSDARSDAPTGEGIGVEGAGEDTATSTNSFLDKLQGQNTVPAPVATTTPTSTATSSSSGL